MFFFSNSTGGCINSSPAGKRRIAIGADQQFNVPNSLDGLEGVPDSTGGFLNQFDSKLTITAIAVAGCLLIVTVFVVIFAVLQVSFLIICLWSYNN